MSFQWGGRSWDYGDFEDFKRFLSSKGVSYDMWARNHPSAAQTFNPSPAAPPEQNTGSGYDEAKAAAAAGRQQGGSSTEYPAPGTGGLGQAPAGDFPQPESTPLPPNPPYEPPAGENPVPAPPPESNQGGGYDAAKAAAAAAAQGSGRPGTPDYPAPGQGGLDQAPPYTSQTPSGSPIGQPVTPSTGGDAIADLLKQYPLNWENVLGTYQLPKEVVDELNRIFTVTKGDLNQAIPIAQAYVRGTQWYADNYPKIQEGINAGLFDDERGYRVYQNQVEQMYQQYYGRFATRQEVANYMQQGKSVQQVSAQFQSEAMRGTLSDPLKKLFSDEELAAYTNEKAGIDTALGQDISAKVEMASRVSLMYREFMGREVTRTELDALLKDGTTPEQVAHQFGMLANIAAMNPAIRDLFTQKEIQDMALSAAGGLSKEGELIGQKAALAAQLNAAYHTYTGNGVTRAEVEDAWSQGLTATEVSNRLNAQQLQGSLPTFLRDIFSQEELQQAAGATAGSNLSASAVRNQQIVQGAGAYQNVVRQYENRNVTRDELNSFYDQNLSADTLAKRYQGQGIIASKGDLYQLAAGASGGGQFTGEELNVLGQQQAGIDTILGQQLNERLTRAQKRIAGAFNSATSKPALSFVGGRLTTSRGKTPDVGA